MLTHLRSQCLIRAVSGALHPRWKPSVHTLLDCEYMLTNNAVQDVLVAAQEPINNVVETIGKLSVAASKMPYYKFNNMWSRQMQSAVRIGVGFSLRPEY
jgi:hypothetical protein